jgi:hypothetical protein
MKTVQITLDENLVKAVESAAKNLGRRDPDCAVNLTVSTKKSERCPKIKGQRLGVARRVALAAYSAKD